MGVTSGAFYSHFRSKAELLAAIVESELGRSLDLLANKTDEQLIVALESYLSARHVENPAQGCAATSLSTEVASSSLDTRQIFEQLMLQIRDHLSALLPADKEAWLMISQMVGAVMIARAMASENSRQSLLGAVMQNYREMISVSK